MNIGIEPRKQLLHKGPWLSTPLTSFVINLAERSQWFVCIARGFLRDMTPHLEGTCCTERYLVQRGKQFN